MEEETKISLYEPGSYRLAKKRAAELAAYEAEEAQAVPGLLEFWQVIAKRRATVLTALFLVFTGTLLATLKSKPVYRARALLEIQKENPDIPSLQELFQVESISDTYLETQYRILRSENLARRVITQLRLDQVPEFAAPLGSRPQPEDSSTGGALPQTFAVPGEAATTTDAYSEVIKKFEKHLDIEPLKRSRLVQVNFESNDPRLAAQVVNTLTATYIQQNLEARWEASQKASEWLSQRLLDMKAKLEKSEDDLQEYARANGLLFLENDKGTTENIVAQRLRELQEELTKAQAERYQKESLYRLVGGSDSASLPGVFDDKMLQDLTERLAELKRERSKLAALFNADYPRVKEIQSQIDESEAVLAAERNRAADRIINEYRAAVQREQMLESAFQEQQKQANLIAEKSVQYNILKREADTNKQLYVGLLQKLKETGVSTSLRATNIREVDTAYPPKKPVRPRLLLNLCLALIAGLALGVGAAFLQEHLDNTLKSAEDAERFLALPALAAVPAVPALNGHGAHNFYQRARVLASEREHPALASHWKRIEGNGQNPALAEAFHGLRTSVLLSTAKKPPSSLLITSAQVGEGKTTVAANLAVSLAQLGERVLLIDADLRRPNLHNFFGVANSAGVVNFLTGNPDWHGLLSHIAPVGPDVLFSGPVPPNPVDLLSSENMPALLREASKEYKFVVLDSPPILNLADSRILATLVDGVILVIGSGITPRQEVHRACASALGAGSRILGVTINFADATRGYYYSYGHEEKTGSF